MFLLSCIVVVYVFSSSLNVDCNYNNLSATRNLEVFIVHYDALFAHELYHVRLPRSIKCPVHKLQDSELHAVGLIYAGELGCERYFRFLHDLLAKFLHALYCARFPFFFRVYPRSYFRLLQHSLVYHRLLKLLDERQ